MAQIVKVVLERRQVDNRCPADGLGLKSLGLFSMSKPMTCASHLLVPPRARIMGKQTPSPTLRRAAECSHGQVSRKNCFLWEASVCVCVYILCILSPASRRGEHGRDKIFFATRPASARRQSDVRVWRQWLGDLDKHKF